MIKIGIFELKSSNEILYSREGSCILKENTLINNRNLEFERRGEELKKHGTQEEIEAHEREKTEKEKTPGIMYIG